MLNRFSSGDWGLCLAEQCIERGVVAGVTRIFELHGNGSRRFELHDHDDVVHDFRLDQWRALLGFRDRN